MELDWLYARDVVSILDSRSYADIHRLTRFSSKSEVRSRKAKLERFGLPDRQRGINYFQCSPVRLSLPENQTGLDNPPLNINAAGRIFAGLLKLFRHGQPSFRTSSSRRTET